jgi:hypothetical protein
MVTDVLLTEWIAHLGTTSALTYKSLRVYRSAVGSYWRLGTLSGAAPPSESPVLALVMRGLERQAAPAAAARRAEASPASELTPAVLASLEAHAAPYAGNAAPLMRWAAAHVGVYAVLRPSELLGSPVHPERALTPGAFTFFSASDLPVPLLQRGAAPSLANLPSYCLLTIGASKADQLGRNKPKVIAARPAMLAIWCWLHRHRALEGGPGSPAFWVPGEAPLSIRVLTSWLAELHAAAHPHLPLALRFTGKGMRRGGASGLLESGAPRPDIATFVKWRSGARMVETYANDSAKLRREIAMSRAMAPAPST